MVGARAFALKLNPNDLGQTFGAQGPAATNHAFSCAVPRKFRVVIVPNLRGVALVGVAIAAAFLALFIALILRFF